MLTLLLTPPPVPQQHVQDGRKENLEGFVRTFQKELPEDAHAGVFALDCEMVSLGSQEPGSAPGQGGSEARWELAKEQLAEMQDYRQHRTSAGHVTLGCCVWLES